MYYFGFSITKSVHVAVNIHCHSRNHVTNLIWTDVVLFKTAQGLVDVKRGIGEVYLGRSLGMLEF